MPGVKAILIALIAGALTNLALAPFQLWPALIVAFTLLGLAFDFWNLEGKGLKGRLWRGFLVGQAFGFAYLAISLNWIANALLVDAERYGWLVPLAQLALPFGLALFYGLAGLVAGLVWQSGLGRIFALAFALAGADYLRSFVLTGFPWNNLVQGLAGSTPLMQSLAYIGPNGTTLMMVLVFAAPLALLGREKILRERLYAICAFLILVGALTYGTMRLREPMQVADQVVRIVQPNVAQKDKWQPENRIDITKNLLDLTEPESPRPTMVVWPEVALPFYMQTDNAVLGAIGVRLRAEDLLVTGALRFDPVPDREPRVFNGLLVVDTNGLIAATYDKHHLVPFGEYVPMKKLLSRLGFEEVVEGPGGFSEGHGPETVALPPPFPTISPMICYEVIFPHQVVAAHGPRPQLLLNVTNDAWYGDTAGPRQHLAQARMRAVEQGLPLVRSANTGISALIDPYGRVVRSLPLNSAGAIEAALPKAMPKTPYAHNGETPFLILMGLIFLGLGRRFVRRIRRRV